jgi:predicted secreted acid phosphatase
MKILAWFGDAAHDFPDHPQLKWGSQKFMLPNPVYGNW